MKIKPGMSKLIPLKTEIERGVTLLRKHHLYRAASRLESLSLHILNPQPKEKKPKARNVRMVGGSGRTFAAKLALTEQDE